jgi:hypothetical protein
LQYADWQESGTSPASFSNPKLSQGIKEAYFSYLLPAYLDFFGGIEPNKVRNIRGILNAVKTGLFIGVNKICSPIIGRGLCGTKQWPIVSAALNG